MRRLATLALLLTSASAFAGDYDALIAAIKKTWPDKTNVAVVCDQGGSKAHVQTLAGAAGGMKIMLIDVKSPQDIGKAMSSLNSQKPELVVLIAGDRVAGDGSPAATFLIQRLAGMKVPVAATTEAAVKQGAVVAVGPTTGGKMFVNSKAAALSGVSVPEGGTAI